MKLSDKQKEVIKAARRGIDCTVFGCANVTAKMRYSEYSYLLDNGFLKPTTKNPFIYELTELGKTIEL